MAWEGTVVGGERKWFGGKSGGMWVGGLGATF